MSRIQSRLRSKRQLLVDEVEAERYSIDIVNELVRQFPTTPPGIDKVHIVWARCLRDTLWLGWLSEAKRRRGAYSQDICQQIDESLTEALQIGRVYAQERP